MIKVYFTPDVFEEITIDLMLFVVWLYNLGCFFIKGSGTTIDVQFTASSPV